MFHGEIEGSHERAVRLTLKEEEVSTRACSTVREKLEVQTLKSVRTTEGGGKPPEGTEGGQVLVGKGKRVPKRVATPM